jgi:hypothetical protein
MGSTCCGVMEVADGKKRHEDGAGGDDGGDDGGGSYLNFHSSIYLSIFIPKISRMGWG